MRQSWCHAPIGLLCGLLVACGHSEAPQQWKIPVRKLGQHPHGAWADVDLITNGQTGFLSGELLAIQDEEAVIRRSSDLARVHIACIQRLHLAAFENEYAATVFYGVVGIVTTLSHGVWLVFTAPVWALTTTGASVGSARAGTFDFGPGAPRLSGANGWARFPAGLPPGFLDRHPAQQRWTDRCYPQSTVPSAAPAPPRTAPAPSTVDPEGPYSD